MERYLRSRSPSDSRVLDIGEPLNGPNDLELMNGLYRLRLREEVTVLKHLSEAERHPNVLSYIDNWEQDEALYIRTELCTLGNFARFLWEYGREFPRLDEARVWKIIVELSNVRRRLSHPQILGGL
jgi:mitosis inhibitor protein kinase SWE1